MAKIALISDIHANLEALQAVLADIDGQGDVEKIYCLGDVCGYGPDPEAVIDLVAQRCEFCLMGNHDFALLNSPIGFNPIAAGAIHCQREMLEPEADAEAKKLERWNFLQNLPEEKIIDREYFVHASPRDKIFEYILPDDPMYNPSKLEAIFRMIDLRCYVGHTHRPGIFKEEPKFISDADLGYEYEFKPDEKLVLNVSSVGQPRDRDPRACYAVIDEAGIRWRRVEYDIEVVVSKVESYGCLDNLCGYRLREGR